MSSTNPFRRLLIGKNTRRVVLRKRAAQRRKPLRFEALEAKRLLAVDCNLLAPAQCDTYTVDVNDALTDNVLTNDAIGFTVVALHDDQGGTYPVGLAPAIATLPSGVLVTLSSNGGLTYITPNSATVRPGDTDTFFYVIDNGVTTDTAKVTIDITGGVTLTGTVFVDVNESGTFDANEPGLDGVSIELRDDQGGLVDTVLTSSGGFYLFEGLVDGTYQIHQVQPSGVNDGVEIIGSAGGTVVANDTFEVTLTGTAASDYDFAEVGQSVSNGDSASGGFWQNKHGQELIDSVNDELATWLTTNFPNVFGNVFDSTSVADFYKQELFKQKGTKLPKPHKVDAQFMATAMSTFVTSENLVGSTIAAAYGFNVTDTGLGSKVVNVKDNGAAFNVADDTDVTVMQLLQATNALTDAPDNIDGFAFIYDQNGNGVLDGLERDLREMAEDVYKKI